MYYEGQNLDILFIYLFITILILTQYLTIDFLEYLFTENVLG